MPSSRPGAIPCVVRLLTSLHPESILDIGVGWGKWGVLFREYTDVIAAESSPERYFKRGWRVRLDGIEAHAPYLTPVHEYVYDTIHVGELQGIIAELENYDLIFAGDVIEHLTMDEGVGVIAECRRRANQAVVLTTPRFDTSQGSLCANPLEAHRSRWAARDFRSLGRAVVTTTDDDLLVAVFPAPSIPSSFVVRALSPYSLRRELRARWHGLKRRLGRGGTGSTWQAR